MLWWGLTVLGSCEDGEGAMDLRTEHHDFTTSISTSTALTKPARISIVACSGYILPSPKTRSPPRLPLPSASTLSAP